MGDVMTLVHARSDYLATGEELPATNADQSAGQVLSDMEARILTLLAAGREPADIATDVGADQAAVKEHIKSILRKAISSGRPAVRPRATNLRSVDLPSLTMPSPFAA